MTTRLFAFGNSFTRYHWPTWADILGRQYDTYQNWAQIGGGNQFIFNSIIECHLKNKFTKNDMVAIMWSMVANEDRYVNGRWLTVGNVYKQVTYDKEWVEKFADTRGYYIRDLAVIYAIDQLLSTIGCRYFFLSMVPITNSVETKFQDSSKDIQDMLSYYQPTIEKIQPSIFEVIFKQNWSSQPFQDFEFRNQIEIKYNALRGLDWPTFQQFLAKDFTNIDQTILDEIFEKERWNWNEMLSISERCDFHPTPQEYLDYILTVLPEETISQPTIKWVKHIDLKIRNKESIIDEWEPTPVERW